MIKAIIVDDESLARKGLALRLQDFSDISIIAECNNGNQAIEQIQRLTPDLVFLDIQMPGLNGFEVLEALKQQCPRVIFTTAYDQYAIKAFEVRALDYLQSVKCYQKMIRLEKVRTGRD